MSGSSANSVGQPRQVTCETSRKELVAVDIDDLRSAHTFSTMYDTLGLKEHDEFPCVFRVKNIGSHVFKKVIAWCQKHKRLPEPVIERDAFTQEVKWLDLTPYERQFLDVSVSALFDLIKAANGLDVPSLYHAACQTVAGLIKGKSPEEVRLILHQRSDLSEDDLQEFFDQKPWLEKCRKIRIQKTILMPAEVLVTILEKLPRSDIDRFQQVSPLVRDVIQGSQKPFRELSAERGPLRPVDVRLDNYNQFVTSVEGSSSTLLGTDDLAHLQFCTVRKLQLRFFDVSDEILEALRPLKRAWKDANFATSLSCFSSDEQFRFAFSEVFLCKQIELGRFPEGSFVPQPFLRLPGMWQCNVLDIGYGTDVLQATDIREWLEGSATKQLVISNYAITGGFNVLVDSLKTAFLEADRPHSYEVRINHVHQPQASEQLRNGKTKEQLDIHMDKDHDLVVKRK